ncbi:DDE-type integrase/transposase/recombinase [Alkaliphilus serpentinus]|uniref:Transposase family protein n=1 Tax=Alkaliphilus serpentinus TaxID=1482731 RepID=A0A833HL36_9FIRM|nr:DDE-type integrase/transposase/recombinase [Alkaliphilus serpentinus]KAB3524896.1 transposase family protein [Alkaliphilus serpentinus]
MSNEVTSKKWQDDEALKRFQIIAPLLAEDIDSAKKQELRNQLAQTHQLSVRSLYRYEKSFNQSQFAGLKPMNREMRRSKSLPDNFDELVAEAIQLKREVPSRSVAQLILILEMEGRVAPGILKRSTLQRHLYKAGFGKKQMRKYNEARKSSSRRFCKPHRMMLAEADIKYGPKMAFGKDGKKIQTYLSVIIDNHSRLVLDARFYDNQEKEIIEDSYRRAILKFGKMDAAYHDRGSQYISTQLIKSLSSLGIKVLHAKPYSPSSKGGVEVFNRFVNAFLAEAKAQKVKTLDELNHFWDIWLEEYYHNKPHDGIAEYYKSLGSSVPSEGISPLQEWNRDSRVLTFIDAGVVGKAFLHHETRVVDNGACISFNGLKYETSTALIGATVDIAYDPMAPEVITVTYPGTQPIQAEPIKIGSFCDPKPDLPLCMLPEEPETSRFLEGLEQKRNHSRQMKADALSFGNYRKEGKPNV